MNFFTVTTTSLLVLTLLSIVTSLLALTWLVFPRVDNRWQKWVQILLPVIALGNAGVFVYRWLVIHHSWQPLESHVDGLVLISVLVATMLTFLQSRRRLESISAFVMPILTMMMVWAICASSWTYQVFTMDSIWAAIHRLGVYLGSVFYLVAAGAGVMFLYVRRVLRNKKSPMLLGKLPSLEAIEKLIIQTATLGFALITLGLITGVIYTTSRSTALGEHWWYSPKVILATIAWLSYALVMNVSYAQTFRGNRAAWLSIVGLLFVLATFVAALMGGHDHEEPPLIQPTDPGTHQAQVHSQEAR